MTERNAGANIIAALRTPVATLVVLVAALLAQLPHAADVSGWSCMATDSGRLRTRTATPLRWS